MTDAQMVIVPRAQLKELLYAARVQAEFASDAQRIVLADAIVKCQLRKGKVSPEMVDKVCEQIEPDGYSMNKLKQLGKSNANYRKAYTRRYLRAVEIIKTLGLGVADE